MNTDTGVIRELASDEKPGPKEVLLAAGQKFSIGNACFKVVSVDPSKNQMLVEGIPSSEVRSNRKQRRSNAAKNRRSSR